MPVPATLPALFTVFLRIGLLSFGGGLTGWIYQEVVARRGWLTEDDFLTGMALGQVLPGANVTNLAVYIGQRLRGPLGASAALTGLLAGPFFAVIALVLAYDRIAGLGWLHHAMDGVAAAAIGLLLLIGVKATGRFRGRVAPLAVLAATFVAIGVLQWPLVPVVLGLAPVSVALAWPRKDPA